MPAIRNAGKFDLWLPKDPIDYSEAFSFHEVVNFHLDFGYDLPPALHEAVVFTEEGKSLDEKWDLIPGMKKEEDAESLTSVPREMARFIARLKKCFVAATRHPSHPSSVFYTLAIRKEESEPLVYPSQYCWHLAGKLNDWMKRFGPEGYPPIPTPSFVKKGSGQYVTRLTGDPEKVERFILRMRRLTGELVYGSFLPIPASRLSDVVIYSTGDIDKVRRIALTGLDDANQFI